MGDGDYDIRMLRQRMAKEPDNLEVRLALAKRYQAVGSTELALEHYRLAAGPVFRNRPKFTCCWPSPCAGWDRAAKPRICCRNSCGRIRNSPPDFASLLGILLDEQKQWADGERAHREALALAPKSDSLHNNLGYNLLMQGKNEAAAGGIPGGAEAQPAFAGGA